MKNKELAIEYMKDFVEGKVTTEAFWREYQDSKLLQEVLIKDEKRPKGVWNFCEKTGKTIYNENKPFDSDTYFAPERLLTVVDISKLSHRYGLIETVCRYFFFRKEQVKLMNPDAVKYLNLQKMLPSWLDIREEELLLDIYNSAPNGLSKGDHLKWCKQEVKKLFKCDSKPPRWVQNPEWPIINGRPLVFKGQSKEKNHDERVYFYFYDPETKEETIITQMY